VCVCVCKGCVGTWGSEHSEDAVVYQDRPSHVCICAPKHADCVCVCVPETEQRFFGRYVCGHSWYLLDMAWCAGADATDDGTDATDGTDRCS
jgi:hypothetical protein